MNSIAFNCVVVNKIIEKNNYKRAVDIEEEDIIKYLEFIGEKSQELYTFDTRIIESVKGAVIRSVETGKKLDETLYKDEGVIHQIAEQKFKGDRQKATDYVYERVASLVEKGDILPNEAREIYQNLTYVDQNGKEYDNYQAYIGSLTEGTGFQARAQGRVQRLSNAILDVEKKAVNKKYT